MTNPLQAFRRHIDESGPEPDTRQMLEQVWQTLIAPAPPESGSQRHSRLERQLKHRLDGLTVTVICGDPVLEIGGARIVKLDGMKSEGALLREWWATQWRKIEADDAAE